jgi:hypothetical protein
MSGYATEKYMKLQNPLLEAKLCGDKLYLVDVQNYLYIFDRNHDLLSKVKLLKTSEQKHTFSNAFSVSCDYIAIPSGNNLVWAKYKDSKVVPLFKKALHDKEITYTHYCESAEHLISAGFDGKVFLMDVAKKSIRYIFKNKPDFCSCALFSKNKHFVFVAYYNGENIILNLKTDKIKHFKLDYPVEAGAFFDDDKRLFLTDREGNSILFDCIDSQVVSHNVIFDQWISCACISPNEKYIIAGSRKNKLYLVDPFKNEVLQTVVFEDEGVTSLSVKDAMLQLSFANGTVQIIDLNYKKEEFLISVELKEYDKAKAILDANNFLYLDDAMSQFRKGFEEVIVKAKELIAKRDIEGALKIVEPFMGFKEYKQSIDLLFMQQDHIAKFIEAVEKKEIDKAYALAKRYPVIESLNQYQNLEKQWEKTFVQARKILEEDDLKGKAKAKEILSLYERIPQKSELVKQLINNASQFAIADAAIKKQDFTTYFKTVNTFDFLRRTKLYERVENLATSIYNKALNEVSAQDYANAKKNFEYLLQFPYYKNKVAKELDKINVLAEFTNAIENDETFKVYDLVSKNQFLSFCDNFKNYNHKFEEKYNTALFHAQTGRIESALALLKEYLEIDSLKEKVANCMKLGYLNEIDRCSEKQLNKEGVLVRYNTMFGLDDEVYKVFCKKGFEDFYKSFAKKCTKEDFEGFLPTIL